MAAKKAVKKKVAKKAAKKVTKKAPTKLVKKTADKTAKKASTKVASKAKATTAKKAAKKVTTKPVQATEEVAAKPQTLSKNPEKTATKKAANKKTRRGRVKSVATLKRAGLMRGKQAKKKPRSSAPEKLVEAQLEKLALKWESLYAKSTAIPSEPYSMKKTFEAQTGLKHKTLGWGFIIDNKNDRLEVLFKDGIRYLISNYK